MPRSALLVSSEHADRQFSLLPLAKALVPLCGTVVHVVLSATSADDVDPDLRPRSQPDRGPDIDGVDRLRMAAPLGGIASDRPLGGWFPGRTDRRSAAGSSQLLDGLASAASLIVLQSGLAGALIPRFWRHAPGAALVYLATESLERAPREVRGLVARSLTLANRLIAVRPTLQRELSRLVGGPIESFTSPPDALWLAAGAEPSPYSGGTNVAVIGSAALDAMTIAIAASACPEATFHLLGPVAADLPGNVRRCDRHPPPVVQAYLAHADLALVADIPPDESPGGIGLAADLAALGHVGLPTVCPDDAAAPHPRRYVFNPARSASLREALAAARAAVPRRVPVPAPGWEALGLDLVQGSKATGITVARRPAHAG